MIKVMVSPAWQGPVTEQVQMEVNKLIFLNNDKHHPKSLLHFYCAMRAQSAVLPSYTVRPSVRLSVCNVGDFGDLWSYCFAYFESNYTDN